MIILVKIEKRGKAYYVAQWYDKMKMENLKILHGFTDLLHEPR